MTGNRPVYGGPGRSFPSLGPLGRGPGPIPSGRASSARNSMVVSVLGGVTVVPGWAPGSTASEGEGDWAGRRREGRLGDRATSSPTESVTPSEPNMKTGKILTS